MQAQELLELYLGIKTHFNSKSYDFIKYQGKLRTHARVVTRKDRYFFEKVGSRLNTRVEAINFLLANFVKDTSFWIGKDRSFEIYEEWQARNANLLKTIEDELYLLRETMYNRNVDFDDLIKVETGQHPALLRLYLSEMLSQEAATFLLVGLKIDQRWSQTKLSKDVLYSQEIGKLKKYAVFLNIPSLMKQLEVPLTSLFTINPSRVNPALGEAT